MTLFEILRKAGVTTPAPASTQITVTKPPFPHQLTAVTRTLASDNLRFGLYDDPGVGKTFPAQIVMLHYALLDNNILVIMPPTLIEQFQESMDEMFIGWRRLITSHVLRDTPKERVKLTAQWKAYGIPRILLMSYTMFSKLYYRADDQRVLKELKTQYSNLSEGRPDNMNVAAYRAALLRLHRKIALRETDKAMHRVLVSSGQDVVVCDEAHYMRNDNKAFKALRSNLKDVGEKALLLMTGTPIYNTLSDACNMIRLTSPEKYRTKTAFKEMHEIRDQWSGEITGWANMPVIHTNLYRRARRILKEDVFDLAKPLVQEVPVKLSSAHRALYKKLVRERVLSVGDEMIDATSQQALRQACLRIASHPAMFSDKKIENEMLNTADEILDDIGMAGKHEKVVLFCVFHTTAEMLSRHYAKYNPVLMNGKVSPKQRETSRHRFLHDDSCRMMIANPESGGVGLNLQSVCRYEIFFEPDTIPGRFKQAAQRVHRVGQTKIVSIYILKALGTLYPKAISIMLGRERDTIGVLRDRVSILQELLPD